MSRYAVVKQNIITNIIEGYVDIPGGQLISISEQQAAQIGDLWDGEMFVRSDVTKNPYDRIADLEQLVADLTEIVLLGGGA